MIAYNEPLGVFRNHIENNSIVDEVLAGLGQQVGEPEKNAIRNSTGEMYKVLNMANFDQNVRVGIEYKIL